MSVYIRAAVRLEPGCRLYYDCPLQGESFKADQLFKKRRGTYATFLGYCEKIVSILDHQGHAPGRYLDLDNIKVRFSDGEERKLNSGHFILADPSKGTLVEYPFEEERIGELLHPVLFYPEDTVRKKNSEVVRKIQEVYLGREPLSRNGIPQYAVLETEEERAERIQTMDTGSRRRYFGGILEKEFKSWTTAGEDLELVTRGNVWALYNNPAKLSFPTDEDELVFWSSHGTSKSIAAPESEVNEYSLESAYDLFKSGQADSIGVSGLKCHPNDPDSYRVFRLHDCFAEHRGRVRALTERLWAHQVKQSVA